MVWSWKRKRLAIGKGMIGRSPYEVGRFTYGFEHVQVKQWGEGTSLKIGSFCSIAKNITVFLGGNHRTDWISTFPFGHVYAKEFGGQHIQGHPATRGDVSIGHDVWIGYGATLMSGITVGNGAVIAANATVVKDVASYEIVGGNPARHIKMRFDAEIIELLSQLRWWELSEQSIREIAPQLSEAPTVERLKRLIDQYWS
jgi:acetyltransferase-like isoleucine patch superfamily enzyme